MIMVLYIASQYSGNIGLRQQCLVESNSLASVCPSVCHICHIVVRPSYALDPVSSQDTQTDSPGAANDMISTFIPKDMRVDKYVYHRLLSHQIESNDVVRWILNTGLHKKQHC